MCCQNDEDVFLIYMCCEDLQCVCCQNDEDVFLICMCCEVLQRVS